MVTRAYRYAVRRKDFAYIVRVYAVNREGQYSVMLRRGFAADYVYSVNLPHSLKGVCGNLAFKPLNLVKADFFYISDCRAESDRARSVDRSRLKLVRKLGEYRAVALDRLNHLSAVKERRHTVKNFALAVKHAYSHGRVQLMPREREEVSVKL